METFPLTSHGLERFKRQLKKTDEVAVEVTSNIYYFYDQIKSLVKRVVLVDTYRFSVIAKSKKKTDRADAQALARFLKLGRLPEVPVPSQKVRELRHLLQGASDSSRDDYEAEEHGARGISQKWDREDALSLRHT